MICGGRSPTRCAGALLTSQNRRRKLGNRLKLNFWPLNGTSLGYGFRDRYVLVFANGPPISNEVIS